MLRYLIKSVVCAVFILLTACTGNSQKDAKDSFDSFWNDCSVIGRYDIIDGDTIIVCDINKVNQRKVIPLELFSSDFEIIKLDSSIEEGWITKRFPRVHFTDNYIAVNSTAKAPLLLFKRDGTFFRKIGQIGQGPGEFSLLDNVYLDEKQNRIYLLPMTANQVLVYDFEGDFLQSIPLHEFIFMGSVLKSLPENQLLITKVKGPGTEYCLWIQDFAGNLIQGIRSLDYYELSQTTAVATVFKNTTEKIDFHMMGQQYDSYHYDVAQNRLKPVLRIEGEDGFVAIHEYPDQFIIQKTQGNPKDNEVIDAIIIDKKTLRGCYFNGFQLPSGLIYDQYTMLFSMNGPFFTIADFGSEIMNSIRKISKDNLSDRQLKELKKLKEIIGNPEKYENDDDVFIFKARYN